MSVAIMANQQVKWQKNKGLLDGFAFCDEQEAKKSCYETGDYIA